MTEETSMGGSLWREKPCVSYEHRVRKDGRSATLVLGGDVDVIQSILDGLRNNRAVVREAQRERTGNAPDWPHGQEAR